MDGTQYNLLKLFADGGMFMYPLILCSLLAVGVMIAKAYMLWVAHRNSRRILAELTELSKEGRMDEAIERAAETPGPVAAIMHTGLRRMHEWNLASDDVETAVKTTGTIELSFLERGLNVLATVSSVAPLLGFLGTVAGMIAAFGTIAEAGQVEAALVAGGIKIALITTAAGLVIAIPTSLAYNFFTTRIDRLIEEMEKGSATVLRLVWDNENLRGGVAAQPLASE